MDLSSSFQILNQKEFENRLDEIEQKIYHLNNSFKFSFWMTQLSEGNINIDYWKKYFVKTNIKRNGNLLKFYFSIVLSLKLLINNFLKEFFLSIFLKNKKYTEYKKNIIYLNAQHIKKKITNFFAFLLKVISNKMMTMYIYYQFRDSLQIHFYQ